MSEDVLDLNSLITISHDDEARTRYYEIQDKVRQQQINVLYRTIKADILMKLAMIDLPMYYRSELMARVKAYVLTPGQDAGLEINMPDDVWNGVKLPGVRIKRTIKYNYLPRGMTKVFCTGLPRTGTTSLAVAMLDFGLRTCHTCLDASLFQHGDAFFDMPVYADYPLLDKQFPDAKFIHLTREFDGWYASLERALSVFLGALAASDPRIPAIETNRRCWLQVFGSFQLDKERYRERFSAHEAGVLDYFKDRPDDLLVIDLARDVDAAERMAAFLGKPDQPLRIPRANKNSAVDWHAVSHPNKLSN